MARNDAVQTLTLESTTIYFDRGLCRSPLLPEIISNLQCRPIIITQESLLSTWGKELADTCQAELLTIPHEPIKSSENLLSLSTSLMQKRVGRDSLLIALGGGSITDLVGFLASIYMRGVPLILIPTTLLSMVDASIGAKTAIDTPLGKNLLGTIYPPHAILADLDFLSTLPQIEWLNGLAEMLKIGLTWDRELFFELIDHPKKPDLIFRAMQRKVDIVTEDLHEKGKRHTLNFGHTIGHALEALSNYQLPHGFAIAMGSVVESYLSHEMGNLSHEEFEQMQLPYEQFPLKLPNNYTRARCLEILQRDKKARQGSPRFALIDAIGSSLPFDGSYCTPVPSNTIKKALDWMEQRYG